MLPSVALGLFALLRRIRCISGNVLKSFILRCLRFWPHLIRSLRHIWSLLSGRTGSPNDVLKKKGSQAKPSFPKTSGVCEEYSAIYASLDFNTAGGSHLQSGPENTEIPHSIITVGQPQSHSPATSLGPTSPGSDRPSTFPHSHSYPTRESPAPSPGHFRSPSPFPSSQPHRSPHLSVLDSSASTSFPDVVVYPPSRLQDAGADSPSIISVPLSPPSFEEGDLSQFRTASAEHPALDPLNPRSLGLIQENNSQVTLADIPIVDATSRNWSDGKRRSIGTIHSEQVSRYANKGTV